MTESSRADYPSGNDTQAKPSIEDIAADYADRLIAGEKLPAEEILSAHPTMGHEILDHLEAFLHCTPDSNEPLGTLGDYTLRREIGRGGMGVVYDAWQNSMDRQVALKVLPAGIAADRHACARFMREAQTAGHLSHPNVVPVHAMGVDENTPYYAMEYVEGETLAQILVKLKETVSDAETVIGKKDQVGYFANIANAFADVADGLQHAHSKGVIHRDIKPSNLILDTEGHLRILDFGLAHLEGQESLTVSSDVVGTPLYMSPEQARRRKIPVDHRTDVYSLGATLYEMLTLRPPFRGKDHQDTLSQIIEREPARPSAVNPRVPKDLETIVLKCLRKELENRYGTAEALAQDLRRFVRGDPIEARPQARWERVAGRLKRHRTKLLLAAIFLVLASSLGWLLYEKRQADYIGRVNEYEQNVITVLKKVRAGQFSLRIGAGEREELVRFPQASFSPVRPEDFRQLSQGAGFDPLEDAVERLESVAETMAKPDAHYHLARAYRFLGRTVEAKREIKQALDWDPGFLPAEILELELTDLSDDRRRATIQRRLEQYETQTGWKKWWLLGSTSLAEGRWAKAIAAYSRLIDLRETGEQPYIGCFNEAYLNRGVAHLEAKNYYLAQRDFVLAQDRMPGAEPLLLLSKAYYLDDKKEAAEATFDEYYRGAPPEEKTQAALWVAAVCRSLRDYERGLDWVGKLGDESPAERLRAYLYYRLGKTGKAIAAARRAIERNERDVLAHQVLASSLVRDLGAGSDPERVRKLEELLAVSANAVALDPQSRQARSYLRTAQALAYRYVRSSTRRTPMNLRTLPTAILVASIAYSSSVFAQSSEICDDFSDGDLWDGTPIEWYEPWDHRLESAPDGDCLGVTVPGPLWAAVGTREIFTGSVSVRARFSFNGTETKGDFVGSAGVAVGAFGDYAQVDFYVVYLEVVGDSMGLYKHIEDVGHELGRVQLDPELSNAIRAAAEIEFEFTATVLTEDEPAVRLDVRIWQPGDARPEPQLSFVDRDDPYTSGPAGFGVGWEGGPPIRLCSVCLAVPVPFRRGDSNGDGAVNITDATHALNWLFNDGPEPGCRAALNTNGDDKVDIADATYLLEYLFSGGPAPAAPFADCAPGMLPADQSLGCEMPPPSCDPVS